MLNTPVLFIVFNRPETTVQVFEAIRKAKPKQLFVAADGPRLDKEGEKERCEEARRIATDVDWDCEVKTLFREENIGCGRGPAEAITWFFKYVEQGIILEDDCLPTQSFFKFCEELLIRYKEDENIFIISGTNQLGIYQSHYSYFFSNIAGIWGWATWKRAWDVYDYSMKSWADEKNKESVTNFFRYPWQREYYIKRFEETYRNDVSWWDYQWYYTRIINKSLGIIPAKNLISNIGFNENATHTFNKDAREANALSYDLDWPLIHPHSIDSTVKFDEQVYKLQQPPNSNIKSLFRKVISKVRIAR
jgi:hypothetical protein